MSNIRVEVTDPSEFHCFKMTFNPPRGLQCETHPGGECRGALTDCVVYEAKGQRIEIMLHAAALVNLIHEANVALMSWQKDTTTRLICQLTGLTEAQAREKGLIA
jgi:hypothetical protein